MKQITLVAGLALALVLPTVAGAKPTPDRGDKRAAATECRTLRGTSAATREAFLTQFRNFGACVTKKAVEEAQEEQNAHTNAAKECKADRGASRTAFAEFWGKNDNDRNAFGKCVSQHAKATLADEQEETIKAAKACKTERASLGAQAFRTKYGTNHNKANAFGKCVSKRVHA
jgi:hypothetical protein